MSSRTESPPAPSRIRCSTPSRAAKSPPPASQGSCTPGPRPPQKTHSLSPTTAFSPEGAIFPRGRRHRFRVCPKVGAWPRASATWTPPRGAGPSPTGPRRGGSVPRRVGGRMCPRRRARSRWRGAPTTHADVSSDTPSVLACSEQVGSRGNNALIFPRRCYHPARSFSTAPRMLWAHPGPRGHKPVTHLPSVPQSVASGWTTCDQLTRKPGGRVEAKPAPTVCQGPVPDSHSSPGEALTGSAV